MRTLSLHPEKLSDILIQMDDEIGVASTFHLVFDEKCNFTDHEIDCGYLLSIETYGMILYSGITNRIEGIELSDDRNLIIIGVDII